MLETDVTLYAKWIPTGTHHVAYQGNLSTGGSAPVDSASYAAGNTVTVLGNTGSLVRTGFTFAGWNTQADGLGIDRVPGSTFSMPAADVTLYAKWTQNAGTYLVIYDGNGNAGGIAPVDPMAYLPGDTVTVLDPGSLAGSAGWTFAWWNSSADATGASFLPGDTFIMPSADVTLHAIWTQYPFGSTGPAGGVVIFDKGYNSNGWRYLETDTVDIPGGSLPWCAGIPGAVGATSLDFGTGAENTDLIIAAQGPGGYAAQACAGYSKGGYSDWYLPSALELYVMIYYFTSIDPGGPMATQNYWSSTEALAAFAYYGYYDAAGSPPSPLLNFGDKTVSYAVRAIRRF